MGMRSSVRSSLSIAGLVALTALVGCTPFCTAIGYSSIATVQLTEPRAGVMLQMCDGVDCEIPNGSSGGASSSNESPGAVNLDRGIITVDGDSSGGWTAQFIGGEPVVGYRLTDAAGSVIDEGFIDVEWTRTGGSEQCGGPRETIIEIPA